MLLTVWRDANIVAVGAENKGEPWAASSPGRIVGLGVILVSRFQAALAGNEGSCERQIGVLFCEDFVKFCGYVLSPGCLACGPSNPEWLLGKLFW